MANTTTNFGRDISCADALRTGRFATKARLVGEAAYRRLTTPRGMLRGGEEEQNYGLDLTELIGSTSTKADAAALPGRIRAELQKDDRIESVDVTVTEVTEGPSTSFVVAIEATTGAGPFTLTVGVDEVSVELLGLTEAG
jgi:hypothetical protein